MWPVWTEKEECKGRQLSILPYYLLCPVRDPIPPCLAPRPHWAGRPGWAGHFYVTFTCTKGRSPGAPSRATAGEHCSPGKLGTAGGQEEGRPENGGNGVQDLLVVFWAHSLAFRALLNEASADLSGLISLTIHPCSHLSPASPAPPSCSHLPISPGSSSSPDL